MHACTHDIHITARLGAVRLMNDNRETWSSTYIALFQPSEDFNEIPNAFEIPYVYWIFGSSDAEEYKKAAEAETVNTDAPADHSPQFAPVIDPTLEIATKAQIIAALSQLGN